MRRAILCAALMAAAAARGEAPYLLLDVDVNYQQLQPMRRLQAHQGADLRIVVRPKVSGAWLNITNVTATWQARSSMTSTNYYGADSVWTSNATHKIAIDLDSGETGTALTNWVYVVSLVSSEGTYPIGTGRYDVVASTFTGAGTLLDGTNIWASRAWVTAQGYITTASAGDITAVTAGTGLTGGGTNGAVTLALSAGSIASLAKADAALTNAAAFDAAGTAAGLVDDLSGVTDAAAARTALGLGTAATNPASAFDAAGTAASAVSSHNATNTAHSALFAAARTNATHINGVAVATVTAQASNGSTAYGWGNHAGLYDTIGSAAAVSNALAAGAAAGAAYTGSVNSVTVSGTNYTPTAGVITLPDYPAAGITASTAAQIAEAVVSPYTNGAALGETASQPGHGHVVGDVSGLQTALDGKASTGDVAQVAGDLAALTPADIGAASQVHGHVVGDVSGLQTALDGKSPTNHLHNGVYDPAGSAAAVSDALAAGAAAGLTAYGWGDHAGLYRLIGWVPGWDDVTNKPSVFTPDAHTHDYAPTALTLTINGVTYDLSTNRSWTVSGGGAFTTNALGAYYIGRVSIGSTNNGTVALNLYDKTLFAPDVTDGASALAYSLNTANALSTSGAKLLSILNNGTEKFYVDKDGGIRVGTTGSGYQWLISGGSISFYFGSELRSSITASSNNLSIIPRSNTASVIIGSSSYANANLCLGADYGTVTGFLSCADRFGRDLDGINLSITSGAGGTGGSGNHTGGTLYINGGAGQGTAGDGDIIIAHGTDSSVAIGTNAPASDAKLQLNGAMAFNVTTAPTPNTGRVYLYATNSTSAELNIMDGAGNVTQIGFVDPVTGREMLNTYNAWTGEGVTRDIDILITVVEQLAAVQGIDASAIRKTFTRPALDWDAVQAGIEKESLTSIARANAAIAAWESNTNSVTDKGPKPVAPARYVKKPKPKWLSDYLNANALK